MIYKEGDILICKKEIVWFGLIVDIGTNCKILHINKYGHIYTDLENYKEYFIESDADGDIYKISEHFMTQDELRIRKLKSI
ncbi:hypothetical protein M0Q50_07875 [bacterium]|jgi:hypothetical protein|nr:hypothetical protein [bacterium]